MKIKRTAVNRRTIDDGVYNHGEIKSVDIKQFPSKFHEGGTREALNFKVRVFLEADDYVDLYFAPTVSWAIDSKLMQTLKELEMVPEMDQDLDFNDFLGKVVTVTVQNNVKDGVTYSNIVRLGKVPVTDRPRVPQKKIVKRANVMPSPSNLFDSDESN